MNFASDNTAAIAPRILAAIVRENEGFALGYGNDDVTARLEQRLAEVFEHEVAMFLVPTGTAANALALAHLAPPWGAVLCHRESHVVTDECGAPEFFGGGLRLVGVEGVGAKISPGALQAALAQGAWGGPHHLTPAALSISQATEAGTIYSAAEISALAEIAHGQGMAVHMDGARLANAIVRLGVTPAEATWKAGVDVLSFGATKAGAMAAEAIVFFDRGRAHGLAERRKRGGHLVSKHRFVAAQFEAFLAADYWLALARDANALAEELGARLARLGVKPVWPLEANIVFIILPKILDEGLRRAGARYYVRASESLPAQLRLQGDEMLVRLVTSFATTAADIDRFLAHVEAGLAAQAPPQSRLC
jgi:threonine aldolase